MPGYYRRYSYRYRPRYYKKKYYKGLYRKVWGNKKAAAAQKDSLTATVKYDTSITVKGSGQNYSTYTANIYRLLGNSPMYSAFASMYDQFKINCVTINISQRYVNSLVVSPLAPLTMVTAWDRNGLSYNKATSQLHTPTFEEVSQQSSAYTKQAVYGCTYKTKRTLYPSTLMEKSEYLSTAKLAGTVNDTDVDDPRSLIESGSYKNKPLFMLGIQAINTIENNVDITTLDISVEFVVTFRGLRKIPVSN